MLSVRLRDSLSNLAEALQRLFSTLGRGIVAENVLVSAGADGAAIAQAGASDVDTVRAEVKENRKLSPAEVADVVARYEAGATIRSLAKAFGLHEQTVRAHLRRQGVKLRPLRPLTESQEREVVRLYVDESQTMAEVAAVFKVGQTAIRNVLVRRGVERRRPVRRAGRS
jgi:DNA invertase Pin-like site-specific DNA recombinase